MRIVVRADDGDQITVKADDLATEQRIVRLEFHNLTFNEIDDFESITLTVERARELASALAIIAASVDDVAGAGKPASASHAPHAVGSPHHSGKPLA
jgi:hypothetical protein